MIKFALEEGAVLPKRGKVGDAGLDITCLSGHKMGVGSRKMIRTGVHLADLPKGIYLRVAPRSKLANKYGLDVLAGVVDNNYRGEICVILINTGLSEVDIPAKSKIAQLIPEKYEELGCVEVAMEGKTETKRGKDGIQDSDLRL